MMETIRWLGLATVVTAAVLLLPSSVSAHADYDRSTPAQDEVVQEAPAQLDVFFTQEMFRREGANYLHVINESGEQVNEGDGVIDDDDRTLMIAELPPDLPPGRYIVQWKTLSFEDGDDDEGAFCFYIAVEPTQAQQDECTAFANEEEPTAPPSSGTAAAPTLEGPTEPAVEPTEGVTPASTAADEASGEDDDGGLSTGAVIGIVVAAGVAAVVVGGGVFIWLRRTLT